MSVPRGGMLWRSIFSQLWKEKTYIAEFNKAINADIDEINKSNDLLEVN